MLVPREYTVMGDAVNLAARLMQQAGFGRTLASEAVFGATAELAWEEVEPFAVKGKSGRVRAAMPRLGRTEGSPRAELRTGRSGSRVPRRSERSDRRSDGSEARGRGERSRSSPRRGRKSALLDRARSDATTEGIPVVEHRVRPFESNLVFAWDGRSFRSSRPSSRRPARPARGPAPDPARRARGAQGARSRRPLEDPRLEGGRVASQGIPKRSFGGGSASSPESSTRSQDRDRASS